MQLDLLWSFMQSDMEADRFEAEMRQAPNRQKLLKNRAFLVEQQNNMKRIEAEIANMADRIDAIQDESDRLSALVESTEASVAENPPEDPESADKMVQQVTKLLETLSHYEQELARIRKDADVRDRQQKEIRVRAAKAKAEYDQVKIVYDAEFKRDSQKLQELREAAEKAGSAVDRALMERYKAIKQHSTPPMALLVGDQCGGCNMSLPSVMLRDIRSGEKIVECDNCGRIIYVKEGE